MVALEARLFYQFGEELEFMYSNEYRDMIEKIARSEDSVIGYFDRVCRQLGFLDEDYDEEEIIDFQRDIYGVEPNKVDVQTIRRLIGVEPVPDDSAAIWILANIAEYDLYDVGKSEMLDSILDVAERSFYRFTQGGVGNIALSIFDIESLRAQVGFNPLGIINRWRNP